MEANWDTLPLAMKELIVRAGKNTQSKLRDQEISNTIYGLCLMQASWMSLGDDMRAIVLRSLRDEMVFSDDLPQVKCCIIIVIVASIVIVAIVLCGH